MNMSAIVTSLAKIRMTERNADMHLDSLVNDVKVRYLFPLPSLFLYWEDTFCLYLAFLSSTNSLFLSAS